MIGALDENENLTVLGTEIIYFLLMLVFTVYATLPCLQLEEPDHFCFLIGRQLSMLPVEPKLGKMLILGAIFNCLDPVMSIVAGLSVRDPFLMPFDKKDVSLFFF